MTRLIAITGWKPWQRRLAWLHEQVRANPTMPYFLDERFGLELAFDQIRRHYNQSGRYPWPPETPEQQRFYSFLAMVSRCHHRLNSKGKIRLKGMIVDALKSDSGFSPLAYEMKTVAHLMSQGFDVVFYDMDQGGGFDYLIEKDGIELEIECKLISADIGRQIHPRKFHLLSTTLLPEMANILSQEIGGYLIRITIPGRLNGDRRQHHEIRDLMLKAVADQETEMAQGEYKVSTSRFSISESPFGNIPRDDISMDHIQRFLLEGFEIEDRNVLVQFRPKNGAVLVIVESEKNDTVLKEIHHQLKKAARNQLIGELPGILCCELSDLTEDQLLALGSAEELGTGIQYMISNLITKCPKIHTVVFTSKGTVRMKKSSKDGLSATSLQETGPAYTFINPDHPLAGDKRYDIFN